MKKRYIAIFAGIAAILLALKMIMKSTYSTSISIIGGADGPTSIFLAGKISSDFETAAFIIGIIIIIAVIILFFRRRK